MENETKRDEQCAKAIDATHYKAIYPEDQRESYENGFVLGFDAGAASIDRREVVAEAFDRFEIEINGAIQKFGWRSAGEIKVAMDAVLSEMEEK